MSASVTPASVPASAAPPFESLPSGDALAIAFLNALLAANLVARFGASPSTGVTTPRYRPAHPDVLTTSPSVLTMPTLLPAWSCMRVLTTSRGYMTAISAMPATPPARKVFHTGSCSGAILSQVARRTRGARAAARALGPLGPTACAALKAEAQAATEWLCLQPAMQLLSRCSRCCHCSRCLCCRVWLARWLVCRPAGCAGGGRARAAGCSCQPSGCRCCDSRAARCCCCGGRPQAPACAAPAAKGRDGGCSALGCCKGAGRGGGREVIE